MMIAPGERKEFVLKQLKSTQPLQLKFSSINDYGAQDRYTAQLSNSAPTRAGLNKESP